MGLARCSKESLLWKAPRPWAPLPKSWAYSLSSRESFSPSVCRQVCQESLCCLFFFNCFFFLWLPTSWAVICLTPLIWKGKCSSPVPPLAWQKEFEPARTLWRIVTRCSGFKEPLSDSLWRLVFMAFPPKCSHTCGRRQSLHLVPVLPTTIPPFRHLCSLRQEKKRKSSVS